MDRLDNRLEWSANERKAATINHERRSEEVQLERLKLRLDVKLQEAAARDRILAAA